MATLGRRPVAPAIRFWAKVDRDGPVPTHRPDLGPCWVWTSPPDKDGYGVFQATTKRQVRAHRWAYEAEVGPIPPGLTLDHLCRVRRCVRPTHLEPVSSVENVRRGLVLRTTCAEGHPFDGMEGGHRICRRCRLAKAAAAKRRRVEARTGRPVKVRGPYRT